MFVFNGWIPWILTVVALTVIIFVVRAVRQFIANQHAMIATKHAAIIANAAEIERRDKLAELNKKLATANRALAQNTEELAKIKPREGTTRVALSKFDLGQIRECEDSVANYTARVKTYREQIEMLSSPTERELSTV